MSRARIAITCLFALMAWQGLVAETVAQTLSLIHI